MTHDFSIEHRVSVTELQSVEIITNQSFRGQDFSSGKWFDTLVVTNDAKATTAPTFSHTGTHCLIGRVWREEKDMCIKTRCNEWPRKHSWTVTYAARYFQANCSLNVGGAFLFLILRPSSIFSRSLFSSLSLLFFLHTQVLSLNLKVLCKDSVSPFSKIWVHLNLYSVRRRGLRQRRRKTEKGNVWIWDHLFALLWKLIGDKTKQRMSRTVGWEQPRFFPLLSVLVWEEQILNRSPLTNWLLPDNGANGNRTSAHRSRAPPSFHNEPLT